MQDAFTGQPTRLRGRTLPGQPERRAILDDYRRGLAALDRLGAAAAECGVRAHTDRDLVLAEAEELSLLEAAGGAWAEFGAALRAWRAVLPLLPLDLFGFPAGSESPLEDGSPRLVHIGGGVEAWAFAAEPEGSVYKFFRPREGGGIGSTFAYAAGTETFLRAMAVIGDYRDLLEKLFLINLLDGMATELVGLTPEGILVAKQVNGERLPEAADVLPHLPPALIDIPSRFLRVDRDHPRLAFVGTEPWLIADMHDRNLVRAGDGRPRIIDLVAAPMPRDWIARSAPIRDWLARVHHDPSAGLLPAVADDEL